MIRNAALAALVLIVKPAAAQAQNLFQASSWPNVAGDLKASRIGDVLTIVVYQSTEARNAAQNSAARGWSADGDLNTDLLKQNGEIGVNSDYLGRGEVRRSESFVTQISVTVRDMLPNGDLVVSGEQLMKVNGEKTRIAVRGRVRPYDISHDNQILSTRIADAEISYDGQGFVSRNANPGPLNWLFNLLGLSG